jgi:AraC-like DNA-binding protein
LDARPDNVAGQAKRSAGLLERFSTQRLHEASRFLHWRDAVCRYYPRVELESDAREDFAGAISTRQIGPMRVTDVTSGRQVVRRSARAIASDPVERLQFNFQISGSSLLEQDGRECVADPGSFVLYDSTRPYELRFRGPFRQLSVTLPRTLIRDRYGSIDDFTARALDGNAGPGRFLFGFVRQVALEEHESDRGPLAERLRDHFGDLLMTALSGARSDSRSADRSPTMLRAKLHALSHLRDPNLSPASIAQDLGISERRLYALFASEEMTPMRWLQSCRLSRCKADLEDPVLSSRAITDIAYAWGFSDAAHFSRLFRKVYGVSPRECRANGRFRSSSSA